MRPAGFDTNRTSGAARPAHKFTRANDFMGLSALLRNFCGRNSYPMHSERRSTPTASCARLLRRRLGAAELQRNETNPSLCEMCGFASRRISRSIVYISESIISRNRVFRGVDPLFISSFRAWLSVNRDSGPAACEAASPPRLAHPPSTSSGPASGGLHRRREGLRNHRSEGCSSCWSRRGPAALVRLRVAQKGPVSTFGRSSPRVWLGCWT
jgi:hypothetical protein